MNLHALQPNLKLELYYILAIDENNFRFAGWDDEPAAGETLQHLVC